MPPPIMKRIERSSWAQLVEAAYARGEFVPDSQRVLVQVAERQLYALVAKAVQDYVDDPELCSERRDEFPSRAFLSGHYYLRRLADHGMEDGRHRLMVTCACLGVDVPEKDGDYLGLDIRLSVSSSGEDLRVDDIDSFAM